MPDIPELYEIALAYLSRHIYIVEEDKDDSMD